MMKYLQRLGKSLMLPVACLPVAGILKSIHFFLNYIGSVAYAAGEKLRFLKSGEAYFFISRGFRGFIRYRLYITPFKGILR